MQEKIVETNVRVLTGPGDELGVSYTQEIPDHFFTDIQDRFTGTNDKVGELLFVGSVPVGLADRWMREGYNVFAEPIRTTLAKLKAEDFGRCIATAKSI